MAMPHPNDASGKYTREIQKSMNTKNHLKWWRFKSGNVPEQDMYADDAHVEFAWGVGGDNKKNSSKLDTTRMERT